MRDSDRGARAVGSLVFEARLPGWLGVAGALYCALARDEWIVAAAFLGAAALGFGLLANAVLRE